MSDAMDEIRVPPVVAPPVRGRGPHREFAPAATAISLQIQRTVVAVVVGGWLKDQTARTLQPALRACGVRTVSPEGWDDWQAPVAALARQAIRDVNGPVSLALIGHSFGGQAVCDAVRELARDGIYPALVGLIDPVSPKMGIPRPVALDTTFRERGGVLRVYYRWFLLGPIRANVVDGRGAKLATRWRGCRRVGFGHNTMCHCHGLVSELVGLVGALRS